MDKTANKKEKLFKYLKEIFKLKTRIVSDYHNYDKNYDLNNLKEKFNEITEIGDYSEDISKNEEYIVIKYIAKKLEMPIVPFEIKKYVKINYDNTISIIEEKDENKKIEKELYNSIKEKCREHNEKCIEIRKTNNLIDEWNQIYEYLYDVYKKQNELEEKIEVVFCKGLFIYNDYITSIRRHIMEIPIEINVNHRDNIIYLRINRREKSNLETNFISNIKNFEIKDQKEIYKLKEEIYEKYEDNQSIDFEELFQRYLNYVSFTSEYLKDCDLKEYEIGKCYIKNNDSIIIRKKQPTIWLDDINTILNKIEEKGDISFENPIIDLLLEDNEEKIEKLLNSKEEYRILFPLPSNDEQMDVVRQAENSNLVLVQGPPGTGKSHTITNMISTFVANGKRVLVTSEKSKALEVVKEKIPEEIRDLSLSLLNNSNQDSELNKSVQTVLERFRDKDILNEYEFKIENLNKELSEIENKNQENHNKIIEIMLSDTKDNSEELSKFSTIKLNSYKLVDIAKYLNKNLKLDIIKDINEFKDLKFDSKILYQLDKNIDEIRKYKSFLINKKVNLPENIEFDKIEYEIEKINNIKSNIKEDIAFDDLESKDISAIDTNYVINRIKKINRLEEIFGKDFVINNYDYKPKINKTNEIIIECQRQKEYFENKETEFVGKIIKYDENKIYEYSKALNKINQKILDKNKITFIDKITLKKEIELISEIILNNKEVYIDDINKENIKVLLDKINYDIKVRLIIESINNDLKKVDIFNNMNKIEFSRNIKDIIEILNTFVEYKNIKNEIIKNVKESFINNYRIQQLVENEDIENIFKFYTNMNNYKELIKYQDALNNEIKLLENNVSYNINIFENLVLAVNNLNIKEYREQKKKIKEYYNIEKIYKDISSQFSNETKKFKKFIFDYIELEESNREEIKNNFNKYFDYYNFKMFFCNNENNNDKIKYLFENKNKLTNKAKKIKIELISNMSWYYQIKNMTAVTCRYLSEWQNLKTKLGKGTGKKANIIRKEMQIKMQEAKNAFPIWIMPVDKVVEQYPYSENTPFDVIIMDESSQSSILSITALLRGKKCIIVGDDKQISPIAVGININELRALQREYLKETCLGVDFDMEKSLYDITQNICGSKKVILKEHFRCLPEIINFSNKNFYSNQINCLKVRGKENTIREPIKTVFVENGKVKRESGNNIINVQEVIKIIEILKNIENDESYKNKTIGIIALQNSKNHIKMITNAIWKNFSEKFMDERKIKVGNAYDFQGDERDVIILSMITSKFQEDDTENRINAITKKADERSYNVAASRAREQMILVHSIRLEELNPVCLRYKLISYCSNYKAEKELNDPNIYESNFEKDLYNSLNKKGIDLQYKCKIGKYFVDFVIENEKGKKIIIECDGDNKYSKEEYEADIKKQDVLERCGWNYIRIRASQFYYDEEKCINEISKEINNILE